MDIMTFLGFLKPDMEGWFDIMYMMEISEFSCFSCAYYVVVLLCILCGL